MTTALQIALAGYLFFGQLVPSDQNRIVKHAGLQVIHADGSVTLRLQEKDKSVQKLEDGELHTIILKDEYQQFELKRFVRSWDDCDVVETWIEVSNDEKGPVKLLHADSFATTIKTEQKTVKVLSLTGTWAYEANLYDSPVAPGQIVELKSCEGTRDAWESNAAMMISFGDNVTEDAGEVLGVALEWTGTTDRRIRRNWNGKEVSVMAGVDMTTGPYTLDAGKTFVSPKAIIVRSDRGRGEVSRQFHRWARKHLMPNGNALRPILLNHWEGCGFDITEEILTKMMDGVKEMGGEMFVLDDGWFGRGKYARDAKNRDTAGLGDWVVNREVLPNGLNGLAKGAEARGLKFGFWVEPEMVNTKSWLAEALPDWQLREQGRPLALGRGKTQNVLDYCNPAVREYIWKQLDALYASVPSLAYVKWDCNQHISNPGSTYLAADRQANLWYDYTIGLYDVLAKMREKYPQVMIQACASGGGHVDFGFLRYADEVWASDNTDSYQRIFIQWGESQFYPACALAAHVTEVPNQTTKRVTPLKHRFDVAMTGRLGFELVPEKLSTNEVAFSTKAVADYKRIRPIVQQGDLYRLASPYENKYSSVLYANEAKDRAVLFVLGLDQPVNSNVIVKCRGLDCGATYSVTEINCGTNLHVNAGLQYTGAELMEKGLTVKLLGPYDSAVFELKADEQLLFSAGLMSDTHVTPNSNSLKRVRQAYELFKNHKVDLIANVGDIADRFYPAAYDQYRQIREATYPDSATRPQEIFCWDNHDWFGYAKPDNGQHTNCFAEVREHLGITHEPYAKFNFAGFTCLVFPLNHDKRCEEMLTEACKESPDRPVIVFDHVPPSDTVYGTAGWGSDSSSRLFEKFPNVIHISGHTHGSARNEMQIWQGKYTCVNIGCLTYFGDAYAGHLEEWGQSHSVVIMRMFKNRVEFRRYSLVDGREISPDRVWTVRWPLNADSAPYAPKNRRNALPAPQYISGSTIVCEVIKGQVRVKLPEAVDRRDLHQHQLTIERLENGAWRKLGIQYSRGNYWCENISCPKTEMVIDRLMFREGGDYRLTLQPLGFWDIAGRPIVAEMKFEPYAPEPLWSGMPEGFEHGKWRKLKDSVEAIPPYLPEADRKWAKILVEVSATNAPGAMVELRAGVHWPCPLVLIPNRTDRMRFVVYYPRILRSELPWVTIVRTRKAEFRFDEYTIYPCSDEEGDEWAHGMVDSFKAGDGIH